MLTTNTKHLARAVVRALRPAIEPGQRVGGGEGTMRRALGFLAVLFLCFPGVSAAQSAPAPPKVPGIFFDVNVVDVGSSFARTRVFTGRFIKFAEPGSIEATYPKPDRPALVPFDVAGGFLFANSIAVGAGVSRTRLSDPALVTIRVPSPTVYNGLGTETIRTTALGRAETAVNLLLMVVPARTERVEWRISTGPSYFVYTADMVRDVAYSSSVSALTLQNTVTIDNVATSVVHTRALGFHLATDLAVSLGTRLAVTGGVRFSSGVVKLEREPLSGLTQEIRVGRRAILFGLRYYFKNER